MDSESTGDQLLTIWVVGASIVETFLILVALAWVAGLMKGYCIVFKERKVLKAQTETEEKRKRREKDEIELGLRKVSAIFFYWHVWIKKPNLIK